MKAPNQYRWGSAIRYGVNTDMVPLKHKEFLYSDDSYGSNGVFILPREGKTKGLYFYCVACDEMGWEHVSVTMLQEQRCLTWEEMCYIKSVFWDDEEAVMQLHPPKSMWVNYHPYCLHLWRPIGAKIPLPPSIMVGNKRLNTNENTTR